MRRAGDGADGIRRRASRASVSANDRLGTVARGENVGEVTSSDIAPDGTVFVLSRCSRKTTTAASAARASRPSLKFDKNGKLLKSVGRRHVRLPARRVSSISDGNLLGDATRAANERQGPPGRSSSAATASC